ncbi:MAG TPA: HAD family phosphatase [Rhizomicrobium sp.]|jgi:2-haloacid dehalogenase|nr:HAD family phosphatase [Rhizomicrobium sp.]
MTSNIKGILFDLGGVLIDWNPRHLYGKLFGADQDKMEFFLHRICPLEWNELQDAGRKLSIATDARVREHPNWEAEIRAYYGRWEEMIGEEIPGVAPILSELSDRGLRLFALSNWSLETFPLISDRFPVLRTFERIFLSGEARLAKPDPRFYEYALRQIDLPRQRLLFVDDNPRNVEAARSLSLTSIVFRDASQLRGELRKLHLPL